MYAYTEVVRQIIRGLESLRSRSERHSLMILSWGAAEEFAESLKIARRLYPHDELLEAMAEEELNATNLSFSDYSGPGDHSEFLHHFIRKHGLLANAPQEVLDAKTRYLAQIRGLSDEVRIMSVVSREQELPGIFTEILKAPDWSGEPLEAFRYFLLVHIELDSKAGGHADKLKHFTVDDRVLPFYEARLELYRPISALWQ